MLISDLYQPFTSYFLRADIHKLLTPDLLHQLIKGTFKDHLVEWVGDYIYLTSETQHEAEAILDEIDCRLVLLMPHCCSDLIAPPRVAAAAPFPGLRCFPHGRNYSQWTGDDSKALMKVPYPMTGVRYCPN